MHNKKIIGGFLLALSSSTVFSAAFQGTLEVLVFDNFEAKKSKTLYQLQEGGTTYVLDLPDSVDKSQLITGLSVTVEGNTKNNYKDSNPVIKVDSLNITSGASKESLDVNNRKILTLLVDFTDKQASDTVSISDVNSILYTSDISMVVNYKRSAFDQIGFIPDTNQDGKADIYQVSLNYAAGEACNYNQWATDAKSAAQALGINLSLYQHYMFVIPKETTCDWGGLAHVGCPTSGCTSFVKGYVPSKVYSKVVYTHEIGHNLGLGHSATDVNNDGTVEDTYGDAACFMGTGGFNSFKELNAPHRDQIKLFNAFPNSLKTLTESGSYSLSPLEAGVSNNNLLALKFSKADTSQNYYVSYRTNLGPFGAGAVNYLNKVSIHKAGSSGLTYFIQALGVNESFIDEKNNVTVTVLSLDANKANVRVTLGTAAAELKAYTFFNDDNTTDVGYSDWDHLYWKGNCPAYAETVGLSASPTDLRANAIACLVKDSSTSTASGTFVRALGGEADARTFARNGDWDRGYYKWECGLNEYVSGFSQDTKSYELHKIRCAKGNFTNSGQNSCETRYVSNGKDDRGSTEGDDWDNKYYKAQCSDGKLIFGVSVDVAKGKPHKILCCNK